MKFFGRLALQVMTIILVTLLGGFFAAAMVRYSPGFGIDQIDLDPRISAETLAAIHAKTAADVSLPRFYLHYIERILHGDFGVSQSFQQPVSLLLLDRAPSTIALVLGGSAFGWLLALALAVLVVRFRNPALDTAASALAGVLLAIPPAVLALAFFFSEGPLVVAMGLILVPRLYGTLRVLIDGLSRSDLLIAARARGIPPLVIAANYIARLAGARFAALFGIAMVIAFGCAVPIEALCGHPGIGQLAWKAALSRDLPLLSAIALVITVFVTCVNAAGDLLGPNGAGK